MNVHAEKKLMHSMNVHKRKTCKYECSCRKERLMHSMNVHAEKKNQCILCKHMQIGK